MAPMGTGTRGTRRAAGPSRRAADSSPPEAAGEADSGGGGTRSAPPKPQPSGRPKAGRGATFSVGMMTLASLAAVGVLAAQAEATAPKVRSQGANVASVKATSTSKSGSGTEGYALPANSGTGTRIVYQPSTARIWLASGSTVERTMQVVPGTVTCPAGTYSVYAKTPGAVGGDNVSVQYVVRFDSGSSTIYGFDAEAGIPGLPPAPTGKTGGVRMAQLDAQALYEFASVGTSVVVL
jgi:hypothetical protein